MQRGADRVSVFTPEVARNEGKRPLALDAAQTQRIARGKSMRILEQQRQSAICQAALNVRRATTRRKLSFFRSED
jgi:hypothetical protein